MGVPRGCHTEALDCGAGFTLIHLQALGAQAGIRFNP